MANNQELKEFTDELDKDLGLAKSREDLLAMIDKIQHFNGSLTYDNFLTHLCCAVLALSSIIFGGKFIFTLSQKTIDTATAISDGLLMSASILIFLFLWIVIRNVYDLDALSDRIFNKNLQFNTQFTPITYSKLLNQSISFKELSRGSRSNDFSYILQGKYQPEPSFNYYLFQCSSVRGDIAPYSLRMFLKRLSFLMLALVTMIISLKGAFNLLKQAVSTTPPVIVTAAERSGIIVPIPSMQNLSIVSKKLPSVSGLLHKTGNAELDSHFKVYCMDSTKMAQLCTPEFIDFISQLQKNLTHVNLEFDEFEQCCISFDQDTLLAQKRTFNLTQPELFKLDLDLNTLSQPLQLLLNQIAELRYHLTK